MIRSIIPVLVLAMVGCDIAQGEKPKLADTAVAFTIVAAEKEDEKSPNPLPLDKWDLKVFERESNTKIKRVKFNGNGEFRLTMEYQGALGKNDDVSEALEGSQTFLFYVFDLDNVIVTRVALHPTRGIEGVLPAMSGDTIWLIVVIPQEALGKANRIEVRKLAEPVDK